MWEGCHERRTWTPGELIHIPDGFRLSKQPHLGRRWSVPQRVGGEAEGLPGALYRVSIEGGTPQAYASADVFVFPSTTDTFGNVVLEAQASGLPVIVSDQGGPRELFKDGQSGFIVKEIMRLRLSTPCSSL